MMIRLAVLALPAVSACNGPARHSELPCFDASKCVQLQLSHPHSEVIYYPKGVRAA